MSTTNDQKKISAFAAEVYAAASLIPAGQVATYAQIARLIRRPRAFRAVGQALHCNPFAPAVPCHRIIASDGSLGGFNGGLARKIRLLKSEGIAIIGEKIDLQRYGFRPKKHR